MRRYSSSKARIALFVVLIGVMLFSVSGSFAQDAGAGAAEKAARPGMFSTLMSLIMSHLDMVFFTIIACSVIAVTLIVKGFIQVRSSVMLPDASIATIREMIANKQFRELLEFTETDPSFVSK